MENSARKLYHSSIRLAGEKTVYFDPWKIEGEPHDADLILVTHEHHDHYSPEDIAKLRKPGTVLAVPAHMAEMEPEAAMVEPGGAYVLAGLQVQTVAAYNVGRPFHPKENGNVGYVVELDGVRYYVAGDTDFVPETAEVRCDVALVPVGGKYTMDAPQAAAMVNAIHPRIAVPTHYGTVTDSAGAAEEFRSLVAPEIRVEIHE